LKKHVRSRGGPVLKLPMGVASDGKGRFTFPIPAWQRGAVSILCHEDRAALWNRSQDAAWDRYCPSGNIYVTDGGNKKIYVFDANFKPLRTIGSGEQLKNPNSVEVREDLGASM